MYILSSKMAIYTHHQIYDNYLAKQWQLKRGSKVNFCFVIHSFSKDKVPMKVFKTVTSLLPYIKTV